MMASSPPQERLQRRREREERAAFTWRPIEKFTCYSTLGRGHLEFSWWWRNLLQFLEGSPKDFEHEVRVSLRDVHGRGKADHAPIQASFSQQQAHLAA